MSVSNSLLEQAAALHRAGEVTAAESLYREQLTIYPNDGAAAYYLSTICFMAKRHREALNLLEVASKNGFSEVQVLTMRGLNFQSMQKYDNALAQYSRAIEIQPSNEVALCNCSYVLAQLNRPIEALEYCDRALAISPRMTPALSNRGAVLLTLERPYEALQSFDGLAALDFRSIEVDLNRAEALRQLGRIRDSIVSYEKILAEQPQHVQALYGLGNVFFDAGEFASAATNYRQALLSDPGFSEANLALGNVCHILNFTAEAESAFRAVMDCPRVGPAAQNSLALLLIKEGRPDEALKVINPSLGQTPGAAAGPTFAACLRAPGANLANDQLPPILVRAFSDGWIRPSDIAEAAAQILIENSVIGPILRDPEVNEFSDSQIRLLGQNELLIAFMMATANTNSVIENFCKEARLTLLRRAERQEEDDSVFFAALAAQCFVNEYVIFQDDAESILASRRRALLEHKLASVEPVPAMLLLAVAAYFPLSSVKNAELLLQRSWLEPIATILNLHLRDISAEKDLAKSIARLTPITHTTSLKVGAQYEESPYPRWISAGTATPYRSAVAYLRRKFPRAAISGQVDTSDILVAGCGTGQHSVITAQRFPKSRVLGIDLSLASLAYANRKARELDLKNLEFAQADILELNRNDRSFDVIEAVGVLHHLDDPFAGWTKLLDLLHPGGFMMVGLYSAIARRDIALIRERLGCDADNSEIRRIRKEILSDRDHPLYRRVLLSPDFFTLSSCRDLLFHTREQSVSLPSINHFLEEKELALIGFEQEEGNIAAYQHAFSADPRAIDLNNWRNFELLNQDIFAGMYQFWIQKPPY